MKKVLTVLAVALGILGALLLGALFYYLGATAGTTLSPEKLELDFQNFRVYDADGEEIRQTAAGADVPFSVLPRYLPDAFVAVEDKRFYEHGGLDVLRMGKAALKNMVSFSFREGASTISQQLIKNTHLTSEKTLTRKLREIKLTRMLEKRYTKEEILERYLNSIYFGHSAFGIGNACDYYFGKTPEEVTPAESAMLAALVRSPNTYSPFKDAEKCLSRRNFVLKCMKEQDYLTEGEYADALREPLPDAPKAHGENSYLSLVLEELSELFPEAGSAELAGVRVETACDSALQTFVESISAESDLAVLVRDARGDTVKAYRSTCGSPARLPASTIKPLLVYAPAIEEKLITPASPVLDAKTDFGGYSPDDAGGASGEYMSVRRALSRSVNIPAVRILNALGVEKAASYLGKMGMPVERDDQTLALALGGMKKGFPLSRLADGYATLAKGGVYARSGAVVRVKRGDTVLYERKPAQTRVFSEETSFLVGNMLETAAREGTARRLAALPFPVSAKTGTGEAGGKNIDAYTIAYTPEDVVAVWMGNASGAPVDATGGGLPAGIAKETLEKLYEKRAPAAVKTPEGIVRVSLDKKAYDEDRRLLLADPASPARERWEEYFDRNNAPKEVSTRFSRPSVPMPRIFVKNGCVSIVLCHAEYYDYVIKRENRGEIATIYSGKYCETVSDSSVKSGETYTYSVTPFYAGHEGETLTLPRVYIQGGDEGNWWEE